MTRILPFNPFFRYKIYFKNDLFSNTLEIAIFGNPAAFLHNPKGVLKSRQLKEYSQWPS